MIKRSKVKQKVFAFALPFEGKLETSNRWVQLANRIPWEPIGEVYYRFSTSHIGAPAKDAQKVIGGLIIKHMLKLSDEETIRQIQENPYLQYFVGLKGFQYKAVFVPSLFPEIRKRLDNLSKEGFAVINNIISLVVQNDAILAKQKNAQTDKKASQERKAQLNQRIQSLIAESKPSQITAAEEVKNLPEENTSNVSETHSTENETPKVPDEKASLPLEASKEGAPEVEKKGKLIVDATIAPQAIRYPTDISLLNEAREITEQIIDKLYPHSSLTQKPRTYRRIARTDYLGIVKQRVPSQKTIRKGVAKQLGYVWRNIGHIQQLMSLCEAETLLSKRLLQQWEIIGELYEQQLFMHTNKIQRCDNRIVSISQPYIRPMVCGKSHPKTEFGAKLNVSLDENGIANVDIIRWNNYDEGADLMDLVENYRERYGYYPEKVIVDPKYGTRKNRKKLKELGIHFAGKPLGRPKKAPEVRKKQEKQRRQDYRDRIPIEGKFGQAKGAYNLNYIRAKTETTSESWICSIFFVMNLVKLSKIPISLIFIRQIYNIWQKTTSQNLKNSITEVLRKLVKKTEKKYWKNPTFLTENYL